MTKKVVFSANTCWYIFNFRLNTVKMFRSRGYEVYIVAPYDKYSNLLKSEGCLFYDVRIEPRGLNPISELKSIIQLYLIYRDIKPSLVFNFTPKNNIYSAIAAKLNGAFVVNNISGLGKVFSTNGLFPNVIKLLYKLSHNKVDHIFFQNRDDLDLFYRSRIGKNVSHTLISGSGVDLNRFKTINIEKQDSPIKFILTGRLLKEKGVEIYVEAAKYIKSVYKHCEFNILGFVDESNSSSITRKQLDRWQKDGAIQYLGATDNVENFLGHYDCAVLPSYYGEGIPKSLIEALASGLAVITTDNVGCREVVFSEPLNNGFLCKSRSVESLINAIETYINLNEEERKALSRNSRLIAEQKFDERLILNHYLDVAEGLLSNIV